jgi:MoxR-like ATPase
MTQKTFAESFEIAAERFRKFFQELEGFFVEREEVIVQIALALLSREHVLLTGPPGNAKSQLATLVLRRILDEKTQRPSLYARQFTENTVQTDLVGPINFKTLVDSGRTEHFTDEGMLGAVHAFLDEVFDGRDMLLRSTLNILQERELKEGTKTVQGQIECAVMTSNRYLAELLEGSRDTLLAFIDRIGFISFIPKGFADPANLSLVLRRQLSGEQRATLSSPLLVQDLDILQAATDEVYLSSAVCDALGQFLIRLDAETQSVVRADPHYVPTRYLSTRTAVRAGKILKAVCIYDKIFQTPQRTSEVIKKDFEKLYLHLLLGGQPKDRIVKLLAHETDPRERRQLEIVRTEREIFDRCISHVPDIQPRPRPVSSEQTIDKIKADAARAQSAAAALDAIQKLGNIVAINATNKDSAQEAMEQALEGLPQMILQESLRALHNEPNVTNAIDKLSKLADLVEASSPQNRAIARWLRGKSLSLIETTTRLSPISSDPHKEDLKSSRMPVESALKTTEKILSRIESMSQMKNQLITKGADQLDKTPESIWATALSRAEQELLVLWDEILFMAVREALQSNPNESLSQLFIALRPAFKQLDMIGARLEAIGSPKHMFKLKVVGPRLKGMLKAAFDQLDGKQKRKVLDNVSILLRQLEEAHLSGMVPPQDLVDWSAEVLLRGESQTKAPKTKAYSREEFIKLRELFNATNAQILLEVGVRVFSGLEEAPKDPAVASETLFKLLSSLPDDSRKKIGLADIQNLEYQISFLEDWWAYLLPKKLAQLDAAESFSLLEALIRSGLLQLLRQEAIGVRFVAAAKEIAKSFHELADAADELCHRIEQLEQETANILLQLSTKRADDAWAGLSRK